MKKSELLELAKTAQITDYSKMNKEQLINALTPNQEEIVETVANEEVKEEIEIKFNQIEGQRYFVTGYQIADTKQKGGNVISFLADKGIKMKRTVLLDELKKLVN